MKNLNFKPEVPSSSKINTKKEDLKTSEFNVTKVIFIFVEVFYFSIIFIFLLNKDFGVVLNVSKYICLLFSLLVNANILMLSEIKRTHYILNLFFAVILPAAGLLVLPALIVILPFALFFLKNNGGVKGVTSLVTSKIIENFIK
jgi:hypothetical protein